MYQGAINKEWEMNYFPGEQVSLIQLNFIYVRTKSRYCKKFRYGQHFVIPE